MADETSREPVAVIRPSSGWLAVDWRGLVAYRDLVVLLVQRDFTSRYKQTVLGPIWFIVSPLVTTVVFTVVFSRFMGVSTDGVPPLLFYLCGMLGWNYFTSVLASTGNSLGGNAGLFSKVYFPRLVPPVAATASSVLSLLVQLGTFLAVYLWHQPGGAGGVPLPGWRWLLFPALVVQMAALGLGTGLLLSSVTAKYRDLQHVQGFLVQIWMYATPVIYTLSRVPEDWRWVANLNPMTAVAEGTRWIFLGVGSVDAPRLILSVGLSGVILFAGLIVYQRAARTFIDTV
jgi:lipopolysaccharide transport system permease protein